MARSLFSGSWQQIALLKPKIPSHIRILRHQYRGDIWYVIQDRASGKTHRFTPAAYSVIAMLDGRRTLQSVWEEALLRLGDEAPGQEELIQLLSQLHVADALLTNVTPDADELRQRQQRQQKAKSLQRFRSPLAIRIPLFDPDRLLDRMVPLLAPALGRAGALLWLVTVGTGLVLAIMHWSELTENISDRVLMPSNLILLGIVYPLVKACHEFGHGIIAKKWGAEVHEMGIMLLVFFPVPYVDASASAAFPNRWHRVLVSSAGIFVEMFLAAVALFLWLAVEPGLVSALAYNVMLVGGVSTILVNGNPLLRFDGYYIASDLLEIPNMGARANQQLAYLVQRYVLRVADARSPVTARGERVWLPLYSIAAYIYRLFIITAIALFVAGKYFFIGIVLAIWVLISVFVLPVMKILKFLSTSPRLRRVRGRSAVISALALGVLALLLMIPVPSWTNSEGIVWLPETAFVRAQSPGFVQKIVVASGSTVEAGTLLVQCFDEELDLELSLLEFRIQELELMQRRDRVLDLVEADIVSQQIGALRKEVALTRERRDQLAIQSATAGILVIPAAQDLAGRFIRRGELLGYVIPQASPIVRVLVPQSRIGVVRDNAREVNIRLVNNLGVVVPARVIREVPEATTELPSLALSISGGGEVAIDPRESGEAHSFLTHFVFDLAVDENIGNDWHGQRVYVRFEHGYESIAVQFMRALRQLFLSRFNV